ncbi:MAG: type II toxin-antitoxin system HicB family antitoxin [Chloroflexota bacterium]|nr:type II toxin-antitoxin system HicB family antitoxin [Chloroflexota bacterium]
MATGDTIEETIEHMQKALQMHLEATIQDHEPLPHLYSVLAVSTGVPEAVVV